MSITLTLKRLTHAADLPLPAYQTPDSAGFDLMAALGAPVSLAPGARALIPTGLHMSLPAGFEAQIRPRSGMALKSGLTVLNSPGTIDADYRGEIGVVLINHGQDAVEIVHGQRIAQMVVTPIVQVVFALVSERAGELGDTARGAGGFGSTGTGIAP